LYQISVYVKDIQLPARKGVNFTEGSLRAADANTIPGRIGIDPDLPGVRIRDLHTYLGAGIYLGIELAFGMTSLGKVSLSHSSRAKPSPVVLA